MIREGFDKISSKTDRFQNAVLHLGSCYQRADA